MSATCLFLGTCFSQVVWELQLCYKFTWRDIPVAVVAGCAFTLTAAKHHGYSPMDCVALVPWTLFYFCLYLYPFNLCNQITGVEEDRVDKPDRPIPSGLLTLREAKYRWCVVTALYVLASITIGNVWSSFLWITVTLMLCYGGWDKHWFTKNCVAMTLGTLVIGWAAWSIVSGSPWMGESYAVFTGVLSLYAGITGNLQDLRDVQGDQKCGRMTMPVHFGMSASRRILSVVFLIAPVILYFTIWSPRLQPATVFKVVYISAAVLLHLLVALRLFYLDCTYSDLHRTYHFFTKTIPFTISSAFMF